MERTDMEYVIAGCRKGESGTPTSVDLFSLKENALYTTEVQKLDVIGSLIANYDKEAKQPQGGWEAYTIYNTDGSVDNARPTFVGMGEQGRAYTFINPDGGLRNYYSVLELALADTTGKSFANWFGVKEDGTPVTYEEGKGREKVDYGSVGFFFGGDTGSTSTKRTRSKKSGSETKATRSRATKQESNTEEVELYKQYAPLLIRGDCNKLMAEQVKKEDNLTQIQFNRQGFTIETHTTAIDNGEDYLFGVLEVYDNSPEKYEDWSIGLQLEPKYSYINQFNSAGSNGITVAKTQDGYLEIHDLKRKLSLTNYTGVYRNGQVSTLKLVDYAFVRVGVTKSYLLVGAELPDEKDSSFLLWCAVDIKTLTITKTITKMRPYGALLKKDRVVESGGTKVLDFETQSGEYLALSLKDYSYESRLMLGKNRGITEVDESEEEIPDWTVLHFNLTSGAISYSNSIKPLRQTVINRFTNLSSDAIGVLSRFMGCGITTPKAEQVKVRRHFEEHMIAKTAPITNYNIVKRVIAHLQKLEDYTNILVWASIAAYANVATLDEMESLLDSSTFTPLIKSSDGTPVKGKMFVLGIKDGGIAVFLGAFARGNSALQLYSDTCSIPAIGTKQTFSADNTELLRSLIRGQDLPVRLYTVDVRNSVQSDAVAEVLVKAPKSVSDKYGNSSTKLRNVTSNLRITQLGVSIGSAPMYIYMALYDGLSFRYSKDELEPRPDDTVFKEMAITDEDGVESDDSQMFNTAERARLYTKVMNPNNPVLETSLISTFKVAIG